MGKLLAGAAFATLMAQGAMAETVAVSMARFDDNFLTVLRNGMAEYAKTLDGVDLQIEDAGNDVAKQLDQINNFVASGVDAIIVNPVDTSATQAMSDAAADYVRFHVEMVGCRICGANLADLRAQQAEMDRASETRRRKYFQSSAGMLRRE